MEFATTPSSPLSELNFPEGGTCLLFAHDQRAVADAGLIVVAWQSLVASWPNAPAERWPPRRSLASPAQNFSGRGGNYLTFDQDELFEKVSQPLCPSYDQRNYPLLQW